MRDAEGDLARIAERLRELLAERGRTQRSVERALSWEAGALGRLLRPGGPDLTLRQLLTLLDELGTEPERFFAGLYGLSAPGESTADSLAGVDLGAIRRTIRETVREELAARGGRTPR